MNKFVTHPIINSILIVIIIVFGLLFYFEESKNDIVYIDNIKLFNSFNMTKDIKQIEEAKINKQGKELDSLYAIFQSIENKEDNMSKKLQYDIAYKSKAFQELQDNYTNNLSASVWNRLNAYIEEYAKNNHLKMVLGTSGNGNVMFGETPIDITDQVIEYANKKYEGNK